MKYSTISSYMDQLPEYGDQAPSSTSDNPEISGGTSVVGDSGGGKSRKSMRSSSRNFMLSSGVNKSDEEQASHEQNNSARFPFAVPGPVVNTNGRNHTSAQTNVHDLFCQVQELEARLRHVELFLFSNQAAIRNSMMGAGIIDPMAIVQSDMVPAAPLMPDVVNNDHANYQEKNLSRGDLDRVCLPVLEKYSHPPATALNEISRQLEQRFPSIYRQELLSAVRRWFRKRREEMSQRIFNMTRKYILTSELQREALLALAETLQIDDPSVARVRREANLEIADEQEAISFTHSKIVSFLRRLADDTASTAASGVATPEVHED